jgi:hypothetical protein
MHVHMITTEYVYRSTSGAEHKNNMGIKYTYVENKKNNKHNLNKKSE